MMGVLPLEFTERLRRILPEGDFERVVNSFALPTAPSVRINTLKTDPASALASLDRLGVGYRKVEWYPAACVLAHDEDRSVIEGPLISTGVLYYQSLSSMLPVIALDPRPGDTVLDLCAAPGSKTSQIAAHMNNEGRVVAVEAIRSRLYRLKAVLGLLGASIVEIRLTDGRRYRTNDEGFDKILVDAPCSSEGRFKIHVPKSFAYWSPRKIKEMVRKQRGLLLNACRLLKPGGTVVYSTCTFAPEENEGVVDWVLRKLGGAVRIEPCAWVGVETYPPLMSWGKRDYDPRVSSCIRILPSDGMEGFFLAKLVRIGALAEGRDE